MVFTGVMGKAGRQADSLRRVMSKAQNKMPSKVLAVSSGKGGVGKTNVVANLALALTKKGYRVLIFDADFGLNNIDILLGLTPRFHIGHVFNGEKTLEEILVEGPRGLKVLPASNGWQELTSLDNEKKMLMLEKLDGLMGDYDFLIIDTGAGISANVTYFCSAAHETLLVATPEPTSHTDVYALIKVLHQKHNQKQFQLIINSVKSEREALEIYRRLTDVVDRFLSHVSLDYFGYILYDENVTRSVRQQKPVVELYPHSPVSQCMVRLCEKVIETRNQIPEEGDRPFYWKNVFEVR